MLFQTFPPPEITQRLMFSNADRKHISKVTICHLTLYLSHSYKDKTEGRAIYSIIYKGHCMLYQLPKHSNLLSINTIKGQGIALVVGHKGAEMWLVGEDQAMTEMEMRRSRGESRESSTRKMLATFCFSDSFCRTSVQWGTLNQSK